MRPSSQQQQIEPGAIPGDPAPNGMPADPIQGPPEWGLLDASVPPSFVCIEPVALKAGTTLCRVFSSPSDADPYPSWEVGSWWSPTSIPQTEAAWRGEFAVEESWNGGQYYAQWTLTAVTYVWQGPTALQAGEYANGDPAPGYYLPGKAIQVYVAPDKMGIGAWVSQASPWNPGSGSGAVSAVADVTDQTYSGLAQRLGQLSQVFADMAEEGRRKGVSAASLRFQSARVARVRDQLERYNTTATPGQLRALVHGLTQLARRVDTYYPWSERRETAADLVRDIVVRADRMMRA